MKRDQPLYQKLKIYQRKSKISLKKLTIELMLIFRVHLMVVLKKKKRKRIKRQMKRRKTRRKIKKLWRRKMKKRMLR